MKNLGEQRNQNPHDLLVGMRNGAAVVEDSQAGPQMVQDTASNSTPRYKPQRDRYTAHTGVFMAGIIHVVKRWKQPTHPSTDGWVNKMKGVYPDNGELFSHKKEGNSDTLRHR